MPQYTNGRDVIDVPAELDAFAVNRGYTPLVTEAEDAVEAPAQDPALDESASTTQNPAVETPSTPNTGGTSEGAVNG